MKITIGLVLGFVLGFVAHLLFFDKSSTAYHWRVVERYNAYVRNPANYKHDPATGFSVTSPPGDLAPSLAALVSAGELSHVDLVLPNVPASREAQQHWVKFCESHREIVEATSNSSYAEFKPAGVQPLHFNLWFRDSDKAVALTLVRELEEKYGK